MAIKYLFQAGNYISEVEDTLYGSFIEHLGRAVYTGVYEPGHPCADEQGFRRDVMDMIKELKVSTVRYPGGNFVSGYNWMDGVGPKEQRPVRLDYAWLSKETNEFGIGEFYDWAKKTGVTPMVAVNLGTGTPQEAGYFVEYSNIKGGTYFSDLRKQHGHEEPFNFKYWCLGNEMDGPWQTCHLEADDYAKKALETAKIMHWVDPSLKLVACGSATTTMPTYPEWDRIVLERVYNEVEALSCHHYFENGTGNINDFLGSFVLMDNFIHTITSTADYVKAKLRSKKDMMISFDEYNIWSIAGEPWMDFFDRDPNNRFTKAPPLLEQHYTFLDALVLGGLMCTLINHSDRVKMASLAQLVNVIAPIFTKPNGEAIKQTIYYPFMWASVYGRGKALRYFANVPHIETIHGQTKTLQSAATYNEQTKEISLFILNIDQTQDQEISLVLDGFGKVELKDRQELVGYELSAQNTFITPDAVVPKHRAFTDAEKQSLCVKIPALSFSLLTLKVEGEL